MKRFLLMACMLTAFAGFCQQKVFVARVIDGDTYRVLLKGKLQTIRLMHVDAPEPGQFYGKQSSNNVTTLIQGKLVDIELFKSDLYGRQLADVKIDGRSLDSLLICRGWACYYFKYSRKLELADYETVAKSKKLGMWTCDHNIPPWIWRHLNKRNKLLYQSCPGRSPTN